MALDRGHKMRGLGITVDFAPDVDVTDAPDDTVIGDRSFSSDPAKVTEYAGAVRPWPARRRAAAGDQAFPRSRARVRRLAHRRGHPRRRCRNCRTTT